MESSTKILRRMLDERGVEYDTAATVIGETVATFWHDRDGYPCSAIEGADDIPDGEVSVQACITPAQAIAATLGAGTCHDVGDPSDFCCSECGVRMFTDTSDTYTMIASDGRTIIKHPNYCPNCGAKVIDPTTNDVDAEVGQ